MTDRSNLLVVLAEPVRGHFGVAQDHCQQVIEVVRHTARQLADGFHLLGLAELIFRLLAIGDVFTNPKNCRSVAKLCELQKQVE